MPYKNYMEKLVEDELNHILEKSDDVCKCEVCHADMMAIALNRLPPHYTVSERGEAFTKVLILNRQKEVDIIEAVAYAIELVKKSPHHEKDDADE